jgi:hypothetical protein
MKRLSNSLKKMLAGLAYQDAGDYLSLREKTKALGIEATGQANPPSNPAATKRSAKRHIALISDGRNAEASLNYVIDTSKRQQAAIDLLIPAESDHEAITSLERKIRENGIAYRCISLGDQSVDGIMKHIDQQTNLLYLVAKSVDYLAQQVLETMAAKPSKRMPVPLVLIEARPAQTAQELAQSAA